MLKRIAMSAAAAALCLAAAAGTAQASAAAPHTNPGGLPGVRAVNLHRAFEARRAHVKPGRISGVVYARRHAPKTSAGARVQATCAEPNCNLVYHGGRVQHAVHVYLVFWGPTWSSDSGEQASAAYLESFYAGLGARPDDAWSGIASQYSDGSGFPAFATSVYEGAWQDTSTPPAGVGPAGLAAEADAWGAALAAKGYPVGANAQIIIATQSGTCPQDFYAPGCNSGSGYYCAWHSASNEPYTNLPYLLDSGSGCGENYVNSGSAGVNDGWSIVGGHEYAETVTDPIPYTGWIDFNDSSGGEIGDKCAWRSPSGDVTLATGSFAMQSLWSNAKKKCVLAVVGDTVSVTNPGSRATFVHAKIKLQLNGSSSGGNTLEWTASGLPAGLSVNPATGLISGAPKKPGKYSVSVGAGDKTGAGAEASFTWTVKKNVGTPVTNVTTGICLNDKGSFEVAGNPVNVWKCNGSGAQDWTFTAKGALVVFGMCLKDPNGGGVGAKLAIAPCKGSTSELWTHNASNEYVLALNHLCLTDPANSTANGARVQLAACAGSSSQQWTLP